MRTALLAAPLAASLAAGPVAAQGVALFGDARLGLGYNIANNGTVAIVSGALADDVRAISRVRFGVTMTGETDSGITFGATIRADNAVAGQGGTTGQAAGNVFVSGGWGTLTFGDTNGADEQWVGDVPGNFSLSGLTNVDETKFISNGGSFGGDTSETFAPNPAARPTIRYDYDIAGFGLSLSSDRALGDVAVGAGYAADLAGGSWAVGVGYSRFASFVAANPGSIALVSIEGETVAVPTLTGITIPAGEQWSVGLGGPTPASPSV